MVLQQFIFNIQHTKSYSPIMLQVLQGRLVLQRQQEQLHREQQQVQLQVLVDKYMQVLERQGLQRGLQQAPQQDQPQLLLVSSSSQLVRQGQQVQEQRLQWREQEQVHQEQEQLQLEVLVDKYMQLLELQERQQHLQQELVQHPVQG